MDQKNPEVVSTEAEELPERDKRFLEENKLPVCSTWIHTKPCHLLVPRMYLRLSEKIRHFEFRPQDVVLISYPKCGSTWMSEILWAMACINDLHRAEEESIMERITILHDDITRPIKEDADTPLARKFRSHFPGKSIKEGVTVTLDLAALSPDRRVIKTHFLPPLLNPDMLKTCKVVYIIRNPKDVCVSYYHYRKISPHVPFLGEFSNFFDIFTGNTMCWGTYWNHVQQMLALKGHPNIHYVLYEDLHQNPMVELQKLNKFFEFHLTKDQLKRVSEHADFKAMRQRDVRMPFLPAIKQSFFREGKVGGWASVSTPALDAKMNKWIEKESSGLDIEFKYQ